MNHRTISATTLAALVLVATVGLCWQYLAAGDGGARAGFAGVDLVRYYYPVTQFLHETLSDGRFPLWNPYQFAGFPILAAPAAGYLYPPTLILAAFFPASISLELHSILHLLIGGWFMWLLLKRAGAEDMAALVGALAFALSAEMVRRSEMTSYLSTAAWIPAIFWAALATTEDPRFRRALTLAVVFALAFLGGNSQGLLYTMQALVPFVLLSLWCRQATAPKRLSAVGWIAFASVLTLLFAAPQLLATAELAADGSRNLGGLRPKDAYWGSISHFQLLYGLTGAEFPKGVGYVAPFVAFLAFCALPSRKHLWFRMFLLALTIITGLYMLGPRTPVWWFFFNLPMGAIFRNPSRAGTLFAFALCGLAGFGAHNLLSVVRHWRPAGWVPFAAGTCLLGGMIFASLDAAPKPRAFALLREQPRYGPPTLTEIGSRGQEFERIFVDDGFDLLSFRRQIKSGMMNRRFLVGDYEPLIPRAYLDLFDRDSLWHGHLSLGVFAASKRAAEAADFRRLLNLLGVRFFVSQGKYAKNLISLAATTKPVQSGKTWVGETPNPGPRAFIVNETIVESDPKKARSLLLAPDFDFRTQAIIESGAHLIPPNANHRKTKAHIVLYEPEAVDIQAFCEDPCLLVLTDLFYPGWEARVDGEDTEIVRTNMAFRGVFLPPGEHLIEFVYRPIGFFVGLGLLAIGVATAGVGLFVTARRSRTKLHREAR